MKNSNEGSSSKKNLNGSQQKNNNNKNNSRERNAYSAVNNANSAEQGEVGDIVWIRCCRLHYVYGTIQVSRIQTENKCTTQRDNVLDTESFA